jgi:hypothetical protein
VEIISTEPLSQSNQDAISSVQAKGKPLLVLFDELLRIHSSTASESASGASSSEDEQEV